MEGETQLKGAKRDVCVKGVFVGYLSVGKTALASVLEGIEFDRIDSSSTIASQLTSLNYTVDDVTFKIELWDTAGQERYAAMNAMFFRGAKFVFSVYAIDDYESFTKMKELLISCLENVGSNIEDVVVLIVGNKSDLESNRKVPTEEAEKFAKDNGYLFLETSAKVLKNIDKMLPTVCGELIKTVDKITPEEPVIDINVVEKKHSCC